MPKDKKLSKGEKEFLKGFQEGITSKNGNKISNKDALKTIGLAFVTLREDFDKFKISVNKKLDAYLTMIKSSERDARDCTHYMREMMLDYDNKKKEMAKILKEFNGIKNKFEIFEKTSVFEKEITKLQGQSEEWSLFRGSANRKVKKKSMDTFKFPSYFCPICSEPTEEIVQDGKAMLLSYAQAEGEYYDSFENEYFLNYPDEYQEVSFIIPMALWNRCQTIEDSDWHNKYMRKTLDWFGEKTKMGTDEREINRGKINPPKTKEFKVWYKHIVDNYPEDESGFKHKFQPFLEIVYNSEGELTNADFDKILETLDISSTNTRDKYKRVMTKTGTMKKKIRKVGKTQQTVWIVLK